MVADTPIQSKGDIREQQAYLARLFNDKGDRLGPGSEVHLFNIPFTSARERLAYLERLPPKLEQDSLIQGGEDKNSPTYLARKRNDQRTYEDQMKAVKTALAWITPAKQR